MDVYINGVVKPDIQIEVGGDLETNSAHKSSSKLNIRTPVNYIINDCDYIKIIDNGVTVYAGTILNIEQTKIYNIEAEYKYYTLSITDNSDHIASRMADMSFPAGANITQILRGNKSGQAWYNSQMDTFSGLFDIRIAAEGITLGTIDDFTNIVLSDSAALWGAYIPDVLNDLCAAANAWWEITPNKVFNMRYISNATPAPFLLDSDSDIFEPEVQRDAYTLYSAVRVVGGQGKTGLIYDDCGEDGSFNFTHGTVIERKDDTHAELKFPIYSIVSFYYEIDYSDGSSDIHVYHVGIKGLNDNDNNIDALTTYGGTEIELKANATPFPHLGYNGGNIAILAIRYYPITKVVTRIVDPTLANEIAAQRGGTGVIEYTLNDDSITNIAAASDAAVNFMNAGTKRAVTIKFKTYHSGMAVGQVFKDSDIPYCGISGDYRITSLSATAKMEEDTGIVWQYTVEASNIDYRDVSQRLFSKAQKTVFKLGSDFPNIDGAYLNSTIEVRTEFDFKMFIPMDWDMRDTQDKTWATRDAQALTWISFEAALGILKEWMITGNYLTSAARNEIAKVLNGGTASFPLNLNSSIKLSGALGSTFTVTNSSGSTITGNQIVTNYYIDDSQAHMIINQIDSYNSAGNDMQTASVNIDKSETNPIGKFALSITKRDVVL